MAPQGSSASRRMSFVKNVKVRNYSKITLLNRVDPFEIITKLLVLTTGYGGKKGALEKCSNCKGKGVEIRVQQIGPGMIQQIQSICSDCNGHGEKLNSKDRCKNCNGQKVERKKKILEVHIDKGKFSYLLFKMVS